MTLTQMQYFDTLCRYENYTRAAQALFVSQPTISQAIRDLEKECGVPLVCRIGNGLKITPEGEILWEQIRPILRQVRELEAGIAQDGLSRNYIRIGFSTFSGNQVFPQLCRAYHEKNPKVRILTRESEHADTAADAGERPAGWWGDLSGAAAGSFWLLSSDLRLHGLRSL